MTDTNPPVIPSTARPFKITLPDSAPLYVFADSLSLAEKHARSLAASDIKTECRPVLEAEYATLDFKTATRVPGGKEDATVTPFVLTLGDQSIVRLASSASNAEKFLLAEVQKKTGAEVIPVPAEDYSFVDWTKVQYLEKEAPSKTEPAAPVEGDGKNQTDISGIPGME